MTGEDGTVIDKNLQVIKNRCPTSRSSGPGNSAGPLISRLAALGGKLAVRKAPFGRAEQESKKECGFGAEAVNCSDFEKRLHP